MVGQLQLHFFTVLLADGLATIGARIVTPKSQSSTIGCVIVAGSDFPGDVMTQIQNWGMNLLVRRDSSRPSTRGRLQYHDEHFGGKKIPSDYNELSITRDSLEKTFTFLTPPTFTQISHLRGSSLLGSSAFHYLDLPESMSRQIQELQSARISAGIRSVPKIVWEPKPSACRSTELESHLRVCKLVNVFSPNHLELVSLVGGQTTTPFSRSNIERCADRILTSGIGPNSTGFIVVRCGEHGSMAQSLQGFRRWYPPYHTSSSRVIDATGAGNSFLGGFTVGMMKSHGDITEGMVYGNVAASLIVEQFSLPICQTSGGMERWNGIDVATRMEEYRQRLRST